MQPNEDRDPGRGSPAAVHPCGRCGALNGADFDRCIRCGTGLSARAAAVDQVARSVDSRSLLATKALIGLTVLVFAGQTLTGMSSGAGLRLLGGSGTEIRFGALPVLRDVLAFEPWRLLSAVFVHFGLLHAGMNLLALSNLGPIAEPAVGTARFTIAYVVSGILGFATTVLVSLAGGDPRVVPVTAGASGAIFGIMGLVLGFLVRRRDPRWKAFAVRGILFSVLMVGAVSAQSGILVNHSAHAGGLVAGFLFGLVYGGSRRPRSDLAVNLVAGLCFAACLASLVLAHLSPLG